MLCIKEVCHVSSVEIRFEVKANSAFALLSTPKTLNAFSRKHGKVRAIM